MCFGPKPRKLMAFKIKHLQYYHSDDQCEQVSDIYSSQHAYIQYCKIIYLPLCYYKNQCGQYIVI
jgi:hypothetical protein